MRDGTYGTCMSPKQRSTNSIHLLFTFSNRPLHPSHRYRVYIYLISKMSELNSRWRRGWGASFDFTDTSTTLFTVKSDIFAGIKQRSCNTQSFLTPHIPAEETSIRSSHQFLCKPFQFISECLKYTYFTSYYIRVIAVFNGPNCSTFWAKLSVNTAPFPVFDAHFLMTK